MDLIREQEWEPWGKEEENDGSRKQGSKKRRRRRKAVQSPAQSALPTWLWSTLAVGIVGGFVLGTLAFDFTTNAERLSQPLTIIWRALTVLPAQGSRASYGALMIFGCTWLIGAVIFMSEMAKRGAFRERKGDGVLATVLYLSISLTAGWAFASVLAGRQASLFGVQAQTLEDVVDIANHVASLLTKIGARNRVEIAMWAYDTGRVGD